MGNLHAQILILLLLLDLYSATNATIYYNKMPSPSDVVDIPTDCHSKGLHLDRQNVKLYSTDAVNMFIEQNSYYDLQDLEETTHKHTLKTGFEQRVSSTSKRSLKKQSSVQKRYPKGMKTT